MTYRVLIERKAQKFLAELPDKTRAIIKTKCKMLIEDPFPGRAGDQELLHLEYKLYRLHVGRSYTVFYQICEKEWVVKILEIATIYQAHKMYDKL